MVDLPIVAIRQDGQGDARLTPTAALAKNGIEYEPGDGGSVMFAVSTGLDVKALSGGNLDTVVSFDEVKLTLFVTDARLAFACSNFDKGGGWYGNSLLVMPINAISKAMAAHRSSHQSLTGQVRYAWLSSVGGATKTSLFAAESLRVVTRVPDAGGAAAVYLDFALPSDISATAVAAEVARRAAAYRLRAGEAWHYPDAAEALQRLVRASPLHSAGGEYSLHQFPGCWTASSTSSDLAALIADKFGGDMADEPVREPKA